MQLRDMDEVFAALAHSTFRRRFRLRDAELEYLRARGMDVVMQHAADLIGRRLAPARPERDGKQTPMRGHPVFIAQHATGTCCRGCLGKWHHIPAGQPLDEAATAHVLAALRRWLQAQEERAGASTSGRTRCPTPQGELDLG